MIKKELRKLIWPSPTRLIFITGDTTAFVRDCLARGHGSRAGPWHAREGALGFIARFVTNFCWTLPNDSVSVLSSPMGKDSCHSEACRVWRSNTSEVLRRQSSAAPYSRGCHRQTPRWPAGCSACRSAPAAPPQQGHRGSAPAALHPGTAPLRCSARDNVPSSLRSWQLLRFLGRE